MENTMNSEVKVLKSSDLIVETKEQYSSLKLQTNRYKFNQEITEMLSDFAKIHQYDGSKLYKEAWNNWINEEDVGSKLNEEKSRLIKEGMADDVMSRYIRVLVTIIVRKYIIRTWYLRRVRSMKDLHKMCFIEWTPKLFAR